MENTRVILIPDLHGRMFWKEAVANADDATRIIFLGIYIYPYVFEETTPEEAFSRISSSSWSIPSLLPVRGIEHPCKHHAAVIDKDPTTAPQMGRFLR